MTITFSNCLWRSPFLIKLVAFSLSKIIQKFFLVFWIYYEPDTFQMLFSNTFFNYHERIQLSSYVLLMKQKQYKTCTTNGNFWESYFFWKKTFRKTYSCSVNYIKVGKYIPLTSLKMHFIIDFYHRFWISSSTKESL